MKTKQNIFKIIIPLFLLLTMFQACEENDLITPDNSKTEREKWNYEFSNVSAFSLYNQVPAIDEAGNIYAIADVQNGGNIIKLSSSGDELWLTQVTDYPFSRIIYLDNKVYYINNQKLICSNADNGEKIWDAEVSGSQNLFAINNNKIYITKYVDDGILGSNYLVAFNLAGEQIWESPIRYSDTDTISFPNAIAVNGNNIYLGILAEVDNSEFAILNFVDEGNNVSKSWSWLAPSGFSVGGGTPRIKDFAIDDNNNLIFGMENSSKEYVFSVNQTGTENWHTATTLSEIIANVTVDGDGNCYVAYDKCEKLDDNGIIWTSPEQADWDYTSLFSKAPAIDNSGNLYYLDLSTMLSASDAEGNNLWNQYYGCNLCNNEYHNVTINRNGDVIVISKAGITCYKGNGTGLAENGWPKAYGNYGNTGSK